MTVITQSSLDTLVDNIDQLAAHRPIAMRIISACDSESTSTASLSPIVQMDSAITSRIMRLANSSYYGLNSRVTSISMSITMLGFASIRTMAAIVMSGSHEDSVPLSIRQSSLTVAAAAKIIAADYQLKSADMFCLALLSRLGESLLWQEYPDYLDFLEEVVTDLDDTRSTRLVAEQARYGINHTSLSATALQRWGFPEAMVESIEKIDAPSSLSTPAVVLRIATEIGRRAEGKTPASAQLVTRGKYSEQDLDTIVDRVKAAISEAL